MNRCTDGLHHPCSPHIVTLGTSQFNQRFPDLWSHTHMTKWAKDAVRRGETRGGKVIKLAPREMMATHVFLYEGHLRTGDPTCERYQRVGVQRWLQKR